MPKNSILALMLFLLVTSHTVSSVRPFSFSCLMQLVCKCSYCLLQLMGLTEVAVKSSSEIMGYLIEGSQSRTTGATAMNNQSSRSHAIFTIYLQRTSRSDA